MKQKLLSTWQRFKSVFSKNMRVLFGVIALLVLSFSMVIGSNLPATAIESTYYVRRFDQIPLAPTPFQETFVGGFLLPAGNWIINYSTTAVNFGTVDGVRCRVRIQETGEIISGHSASVGDGQSAVSTISGVTVVNLDYPLTINLSCYHDNYRTTIYLDAEASEIAAYEATPS